MGGYWKSSPFQYLLLQNLSRLYLGREPVPAEMVGDVTPVRGVEEEHVCFVAWRESTNVYDAEDVRRVGRAGTQGSFRREPEAGARQVHHERQRLAEGASGVEVGGERQDRPLVGKEAGRRNGQVEKEPASGEKHGRDVALCEKADAPFSGGLEVIHAAGAELDRQRDRTPLGELVGVQAEREPVLPARFEVAPRLRRLERAPLQKDVGESGQGRCFRQHLM